MVWKMQRRKQPSPPQHRLRTRMAVLAGVHIPAANSSKGNWGVTKAYSWVSGNPVGGACNTAVCCVTRRGWAARERAGVCVGTEFG